MPYENKMRVAAGITLFEPDLDRLKENITAILPQVDRLYIIDNASTNTENIKALYFDNVKVVIKENDRNLGIAAALNQMCNMAIKDEFQWIVTLDQDSLAEGNLVEKYLKYTEMEDVALITPRFNDDNEPDIILSESTEEYTFVNRCNASASFVRLSAFKEVGGFDEKMFIDCVDFDYCTTLLEHGYRILRVNGAEIRHRIGCATEIRFFIPFGKFFGIKKLQKPFYTYNHSPLRTYYYARNIRYYAYKHRGFIDEKTEKRVYFQWVVLKVGFEKEKLKKLSAIRKAKKDAKIMIREAETSNNRKD